MSDKRRLHDEEAIAPAVERPEGGEGAANQRSAARNQVIRVLAPAHPDARTSAVYLKVALDKLVERLKEVDYPYDACGEVTFQGMLRRWVTGQRLRAARS